MVKNGKWLRIKKGNKMVELCAGEEYTELYVLILFVDLRVLTREFVD